MSSTGPSTVTYLYGTSSDCTQIVARRERRNSSALRDCGPIANAMLPSSAVNQIGDDTGARSGASTLKTQTRGTSVRKVHRSAGVIVRSIRLLLPKAACTCCPLDSGCGERRSAVRCDAMLTFAIADRPRREIRFAPNVASLRSGNATLDVDASDGREDEAVRSRVGRRCADDVNVGGARVGGPQWTARARVGTPDRRVPTGRRRRLVPRAADPGPSVGALRLQQRRLRVRAVVARI